MSCEVFLTTLLGHYGFFFWFITCGWKYSDDVGVENITMEIRLMWQDKWCKGGVTLGHLNNG